jgi:hypothetical protein
MALGVAAALIRSRTVESLSRRSQTPGLSEPQANALLLATDALGTTGTVLENLAGTPDGATLQAMHDRMVEWRNEFVFE